MVIRTAPIDAEFAVSLAWPSHFKPRAACRAIRMVNVQIDHDAIAALMFAGFYVAVALAVVGKAAAVSVKNSAWHRG
jgi:hypothetical protein